MTASDSSTSTSPPAARHVGTGAYVAAALSFFPLLGVLVGIVAIVWGLTTRRAGGRTIAAIGAGGIALTIALYGGLFYFGFVQRGGLYDDLRAKLAQQNLNAAVKEIEFYRLNNGKYPDLLADLQASESKTSVGKAVLIDPRLKSSLTPRLFYYKRIDADHYYLRGVGLDGQPFSKGSLGPKLPATAKLGLVASPATP